MYPEYPSVCADLSGKPKTKDQKEQSALEKQLYALREKLRLYRTRQDIIFVKNELKHVKSFLKRQGKGKKINKSVAK